MLDTLLLRRGPEPVSSSARALLPRFLWILTVVGTRHLSARKTIPGAALAGPGCLTNPPRHARNIPPVCCCFFASCAPHFGFLWPYPAWGTALPDSPHVSAGRVCSCPPSRPAAGLAAGRDAVQLRAASLTALFLIGYGCAATGVLPRGLGPPRRHLAVPKGQPL